MKSPMSTTSLADPATCGEDLADNVERMLTYTAAHCGDCADYHILYPIMRARKPVGRITSQRAGLIDMVGHLVRRRAETHAGPIDIVIAGAADTQIPGACAHAALVHGGVAYPRVRFTILDRCRAPLRLCEDFAARHGIALQTRLVDLAATEEVFAADAVIVHHLLSFMPSERHVALLKKLRAWLKPGGRILFFNAIRPETSLNRVRERDRQTAESILAALDSGALKIQEPRALFEARLNRGLPRLANFGSTDEIYDLFARAHLTVHADSRSGSIQLDRTESLGRGFVVAVLGRDD